MIDAEILDGSSTPIRKPVAGLVVDSHMITFVEEPIDEAYSGAGMVDVSVNDHDGALAGGDTSRAKELSGER